jgi:hypothetical protein
LRHLASATVGRLRANPVTRGRGVVLPCPSRCALRRSRENVPGLFRFTGRGKERTMMPGSIG